jgi:nicotinate (nicotinamide) nucleotide adenylyltransferase
MKKLIALTGSFNPVTVAHYKILSDAVERFDCDEGIYIATDDRYLTRKVALKGKQPYNFLLPETVRGEMLRSLANDNPKLSYWGVELGKEYPSTYKTLVKLIKDKQKQYPGEEIKLYFLFGADKLKNFSHWDHAEEMAELCEYLVYARQFDLEKVIAQDAFLTTHRDRFHLLQVEDEDLEDVSSTELRRRFFAGEDYTDLMNKGPYAVMQRFSPADFKPLTDEDIIKTHILYGGRFGGNAARLQVFKTNSKLFNEWPEYLGDRDAHRVAKAYTKEFTVDVPELTTETVTDCVNADCVDVAKSMLDEGLNACILNLASRTSPGGGAHKGANAQEESICHQSTLIQSLYQFGSPKYKHIREAGVPLVEGVYPMDINFGGVYSPCVTFFRHNADSYYALREKLFDCPIVTVASLSNREKNSLNAIAERVYFDEAGCLTDEGREIETNKIRTIYRIALENGHDSIVLGAFGCGVFRLHSDEVAGLFRDVLNEPEFKNRFKKLVFAIYEGKPSPRRREPIGRDGKYAPFYDIFGK